MAKISLKSKLDTRGGSRIKRSNLSPYSLLLDALWTKFGGIAAVARLLGEIPQAPLNWKLRGCVPLEKVIHVATILQTSALALNFKGWSALVEQKETFESVVLSCELPQDATNNIIEKYKKFKPKKSRTAA